VKHRFVPPASAALLAASLLSPHGAQADVVKCTVGQACGTPTSWNFTIPFPSVQANNFEVVLPGDQVGIATSNYNSFTNGAYSETYNPGSNTTTLEWYSSTGSAILPAGQTASGTTFGPGNSPAPHFGFTGIIPGVTQGGEAIPPVQMYYTYGLATVNVLGATVGIAATSGTTGTLGYAILQVNAAAPGAIAVTAGQPGELTTAQSGQTGVTNWFEIPYQGSLSLSLTANDGDVDVSDVGLMLSATQIPLDDLSNVFLPTSDFGSLGVPDGTLIANGTSLALNTSTVPEPGSLALLLTGLFGLGRTQGKTRLRTRWQGRAATA